MRITMLDGEIQCSPICSSLTAGDDARTEATRFSERVVKWRHRHQLEPPWALWRLVGLSQVSTVEA